MRNKVNYKENISIYKDESVYPEYTAVHVLELDCEKCGNYWKVSVPDEYTDYKIESDVWRDRYLALKSELVELMRYSEMHYNMNPHKDKFIEMINELMDKFSLGE
jgi:hypothetical protein